MPPLQRMVSEVEVLLCRKRLMLSQKAYGRMGFSFLKLLGFDKFHSVILIFHFNYITFMLHSFFMLLTLLVLSLLQ